MYCGEMEDILSVWCLKKAGWLDVDVVMWMR